MSFTQMVGGTDELSEDAAEFLRFITWSSETRKATLNGSFESLPSSFYMGTFRLSNGVQAMALELADGTRGISLINRYNAEKGSISNPKFFALDKPQKLNIETVYTDLIEGSFSTTYTTLGDNLTVDFDFRPATAGRFHVKYYLGSDNTGTKIFDEIRTVTQAEVDSGQALSFQVGNPYLLEQGTQIYVEFSGIDFYGNSATGLPYFVSTALPYTEVTLNGHTIGVNSNITLFIGCHYNVRASGVIHTFTVPADFKSDFSISDAYLYFKSTAGVNIDLSAHGQGVVQLRRKGEYMEFKYQEPVSGMNGGWHAVDPLEGRYNKRC